MRPLLLRAALLASTCALGMAACGSDSGGPTPVPGAPTLSCPSSITAESPDGNAVRLSYSVPVAQGGSPPVSVTCTPASGSLFPIGSNAVQCVATDAASRTATCSFTVTVTAVPQLTKTRFLAFGDSITFGRVSPPVGIMAAGPGEPQSYPFKLLGLMTTRYRQQTIVMDNAGLPGETAAQGLNRLKPAMDASRPEIVLLMEGTNDLFFEPNGQGIENGITALEGMVRTVEQRGARPFLATIAPQRLGGPRDTVAKIIPRFNDEVRALAARRNTTLVDVYAALAPNVQLYIGVDDLHPTEEGYRVMAETFFAVLRSTLEAPPPGATSRVR